MPQLDQHQSADGGPQLTEVRRKRIADLVEQRGSVAVRDLCDEFGMSEATIRRDLRKLGEKGVVTRTHGGVMMNQNVIADLPNEERKLVRAEEKRRIGQAAVDLLAGDEVVFLDAGTTALAVAENAHQRPDCCYVTTCLGVARRLRSQQIANFFMIGGSYERVNDSFAGTLAIAALRSLTFDIAFFCCASVDTRRRSIALRDEGYSQVQKEAIASARRRFVIADHEKFEAAAFMRTAQFDELDGVVTNREIDHESLSRLHSTELEIVLA